MRRLDTGGFGQSGHIPYGDVSVADVDDPLPLQLVQRSAHTGALDAEEVGDRLLRQIHHPSVPPEFGEEQRGDTGAEVAGENLLQPGLKGGQAPAEAGRPSPHERRAQVERVEELGHRNVEDAGVGDGEGVGHCGRAQYGRFVAGDITLAEEQEGQATAVAPASEPDEAPTDHMDGGER